MNASVNPARGRAETMGELVGGYEQAHVVQGCGHIHVLALFDHNEHVREPFNRMLQVRVISERRVQ